MPWRQPRRTPADPATVELIRAAASERRILRQELDLPPVTDDDLNRWTSEEAPTPGRGQTRGRRGSGRFITIAGTGIGLLVGAAAAVAAVPSGDSDPSSPTPTAPVDTTPPLDVQVLPTGKPPGSRLFVPGGCVVTWTSDGIVTDGCDGLTIGTKG